MLAIGRCGILPRCTVPSVLLARRPYNRSLGATYTSVRFAATVSNHKDNDSSNNSTNLKVDPSRLPSTIPGVSQEELAQLITKFHAQHVAVPEGSSSQRPAALLQEIESMRVAMAPEQFREYMEGIQAKEAEALQEAAKQAAMSPTQLHHYRQKMKRKQVAYEYYKLAMLIFVFLGSIASMFSFFFFFE